MSKLCEQLAKVSQSGLSCITLSQVNKRSIALPPPQSPRPQGRWVIKALWNRAPPLGRPRGMSVHASSSHSISTVIIYPSCSAFDSIDQPSLSFLYFYRLRMLHFHRGHSHKNLSLPPFGGMWLYYISQHPFKAKVTRWLSSNQGNTSQCDTCPLGHSFKEVGLSFYVSSSISPITCRSWVIRATRWDKMVPELSHGFPTTRNSSLNFFIRKKETFVVLSCWNVAVHLL